MWLTAPQGNEEPSGPHIQAVLIIAEKALPYKVALRNFSMVCTMHCTVPTVQNQCPCRIFVMKALQCVNLNFSGLGVCGDK